MALYEDFVKQGNQLFRKRSFLPLIIMAFGFALFLYEQSQNLQLISCKSNTIFFLIVCFGQAIRAITIATVPKSTSGRNTENQVAESLNTKGIYSVIRHPLYVGNFFMWLGIAMLTQHIWFVLLFSVIYWLYYERIMFAEEEFLRGKFGKVYEEWSNSHNSIIPSFSNYKKNEMPFSIKNIFKREDNGFYAVTVLFTSFNLVSEYLYYDKIIISQWIYILLIASVLYLINRLIRKKTNLYNVAGR